MLHGHVVETNKMSMVSARFILHSLFFLFAIATGTGFNTNLCLCIGVI